MPRRWRIPVRTSRPIRRNPGRTQRRLLDAAIKLFSRHGFHAVSVDRIVADAKVNKRMVYHYFGSKDALFEAALSDVYQRIERVEFHAIEQGCNAREKLSRLLAAYFDFLDQEPEFTRLLQWENLEKGRHLTRMNHGVTKNPFMLRFRKLIAEGIAAGEFRPDLEVSHLLIHFIGLCSIYHSNRFSLSHSLQLDLGNAQIKAEGLQHAIRMVVSGISRPSDADRERPDGTSSRA